MPKFCGHCGARLGDEAKVCGYCGTPLKSAPQRQAEGQPAQPTSRQSVYQQTVPQQPVYQQPVYQQSAPVKKKKKPTLAKVFAIVGASAALVALIAAGVVGGLMFLLSRGNAAGNYALYLKDSEIYINDLKEDYGSWQLTSRLVDDENMDPEDLYELGYRSGNRTVLTKDGKYIFFPDKLAPPGASISITGR